mmetsp:Transcript_3973/g.7186  ORF Transcript_3973/g.7186 Transcript_3973/m.7186 type:complete len:228 (-) Transcript_3973:318-1001(-)
MSVLSSRHPLRGKQPPGSPRHAVVVLEEILCLVPVKFGDIRVPAHREVKDLRHRCFEERILLVDVQPLLSPPPQRWQRSQFLPCWHLLFAPWDLHWDVRHPEPESQSGQQALRNVWRRRCPQPLNWRVWRNAKPSCENDIAILHQLLAQARVRTATTHAEVATAAAEHMVATRLPAHERETLRAYLAFLQKPAFRTPRSGDHFSEPLCMARASHCSVTLQCQVLLFR